MHNKRTSRTEPARTAVAHRPFWLYGTHAVMAALGNPRRVRHRLAATAETAPAVAGRGANAEIMARDDLARLLPSGAVHQGIATLVDPLADIDLDDFLQTLVGPAVVLVLDQVNDPQNIGAILRSAAVFGVAAVIVQARHAPGESGALAKAASGALEIVPMVRAVNLARALDGLKECGFWCVALDVQAPKPLRGEDMAERAALVLGAEGAGLRQLVRAHCDLVSRIPTRGAIASLNVANAAAVALYEITKRLPTPFP